MLTNLMDAIRAGYNSNGKCQSFLLKMTGGDARDILVEYEKMEKELADLRAAQRPDSARQVEFARGVIDEQYERIADLERDNETLRRGRDHAIKSTQDMMTVIRQRDHEIAELKRKLASVTEMNDSNDALLAEKCDLLEGMNAENAALHAQVRDLKTKLANANKSIADKVSLLEHTIDEKNDAQREVFRLRGELSLWKAKAEAKHDPLTPALLQLVDKRKQEIKQKDIQIRGLQMQVEALERDATKTAEARELDDKTMANLNRALISRNREIEGLRYVLDEKSKVIDEITAANEQLSAKVAAYAQTIAEQNEANKKLSQRLLETNSRDNERIRELQARIERARTGDNTSIHQLRYEVRRLTEIEMSLREKVRKKDKVIQSLQNGLRAKTETIRNLNAQLGQVMEQTRFGLID